MTTETCTDYETATRADYEVKRAYADCHGSEQDKQHGMEIRNLNFRSSVEISRDEAKTIMAKYVPSYNEFKPDLLNKLPADSKIRIAREGSVCLYVKTEKKPKIPADELDEWQQGVWRIWWD